MPSALRLLTKTIFYKVDGKNIRVEVSPCCAAGWNFSHGSSKQAPLGNLNILSQEC